VSRLDAFPGGVCERQGTPRPVLPEPARLSGHPRWLLKNRRSSPPVAWAAPPPSPALTGEATTLSQAYCGGRYEGTALVLGRKDSPPRGSALVTHVRIAPPYVCGAATSVGTRRRQ
jgi:hypothetical protein